MKPLRDHDRRFGAQKKPDEKTWEQQARQYASAFHRGAVKSGASARNKLYRATHGEFSIPHPSKKQALGLGIALIIISGFLISDQFLKTRALIAGSKTYLWKEDLASNDLQNWNTRLTSYIDNSGCDNGPREVVRLRSNSTHSAVAISKQKIDVSVIAGKHLDLPNQFCLYAPQATTWGLYLTRNGTLPIEQATYTPFDDKNVALILQYSSTVAMKIQREGTQSIDDGQDDICGTGTAFLCFTPALNVGNNVANAMITQLNFTGGGGLSLIQQGVSSVTTDTFPWFQITGVEYYVGLWQSTSNNGVVDWIPWRNGLDSLDIAYIASAGVSPNPGQVETTGFFGPLIKALVTVGIWILNGIATFLGFVADAFVTAMNAVGGFFGLGNIGTAIRDFLTGVSNFIVNVVTTVFGWGVTFASLFQNGISFIANFLSGSNSFISLITSFFSSIAGLWTIIQDLWTALNSVVFTIQQILVVWYLAGMFWVYMDGWPGFKNWIELTDTLILKLLRGGWWVGREVTQVVLDVKRFLVQWL